MYSKPTLDADVASQAIFAANVSIVERKDDWAHVRTADDYTGWMLLSSLRPGPLYAVSGRVAEVRSMFAHIYREPSVTAHAPLLTVPLESRLEVSAEPAEPSQWAKVRLPDDRAGWVQLGDVAFHAPPLTVPEMVEFAKRFLGLPYTWGGTSTYGYDCSGFMQMLERSRGLNMPRDAQPQADWDGQSAVERRDLQPGDLLYFGRSPKRITHTGMYLGGGKFISATTYQTPTIRIDDLEDPHFSRILAAMRRPK
jgi:cell wall-associated NlpC family hydrolase